MKKQTVKTFGISAENRIGIYDGTAARPDEIIFRTEDQLASVVAELPAGRMVEIWNNLPGVTPVKKFKDRATGVARIWKAIQASPVAAVPETAEPATQAQPTATPQAAQAPDVAPEEAPATAKAKRAQKAPKEPKAKGSNPGSKTANVLDLLHREGGATLKELMEATSWQAHSVRGFISGSLGKKMGLAVVSAKAEGGVRTYSIKA